MPLQPSRRDILGPPPRDVSDLASVVRHQGSYLRSLDPGILEGRFATPRPVAPGTTELVGDGGGGDAEPILFENTDQGTCVGPSTNITIRLSHVPEDGSEQVFYNGTPLKRGDWSRTDTALTIPGEPWFRAGRVAWVDYAYYEDEVDLTAAAFVAVSYVTGDSTSIALPTGTADGDMLVLVMCARVTAMPTDSRFGAGFTDTCGGFGAAGVWVGTADGSGSPVSISMVSAGVGDAADGAAVLMAISGDPLALTADQSSTTSPSGTSPFTPATPAGAPFLGIAALFGVSGISSGSINESTTNWTYRLGKQGGGAGKCSVYVGTAAGVPAGTWVGSGSTIIGGARLMGVQ
jgi:hypothetical protein